MGVSIFTDKNRHPSPAEVEQALGAQLPLWFKVIEYLATLCQLLHLRVQAQKRI